MSLPQNNKRQRILDVTIDTLRHGKEVGVTEIAERAGVTAGLIYRYFGDKNDLLAAAYEVIAVGEIRDDAEVILALKTASREEAFEIIKSRYILILGETRESTRWSRLEALAHYRMMPILAERIKTSRQEAVDLVDEALRTTFGVSDIETLGNLRALAMVSAAIPLGYTALGGDDLGEDERLWVAELIAFLAVQTLDRAGYQWPQGGTPPP